jgi:site-specific DNA-methyltransferase (adenine-specific)
MISTELFLGDCLEIMPQGPDKSVDLILCDLPYGTTACKWDVIIPFDRLW